MGALGGLVALERFLGVDVAERRVGRNEPLGGLHAEALREHRAERDHLHVPEAGERPDPPAQVRGVACLAPQPIRVAGVLLLHEGAELADLAAIAPGNRCTAGVSRNAASTSRRIEACDLERS